MYYMKIGLLAISKCFAIYHILIGSTITLSDLHQKLQWIAEITKLLSQRCLFLTPFPALRFQEQDICAHLIKIKPDTRMLLATTHENTNQKKINILHSTNHTAQAMNLAQQYKH